MRLPPALLPATAVLWIVALVAAPLAVDRGSLPALTVAVYGSASLLCHQKSERSFALARVPLPVCGRCTGLYVSGAAGAVAALVRRSRRVPGGAPARLALAFAAVPMAVSLGAEWLGLGQGSNMTRFFSALPLGLTAGWLLQSVAASTALDGAHAQSDIIS